jgi:hypothetical protein
VASGEVGVRPSVLVWDCESRRLLSTLQGFHRNGVAQVDFSPDKSRLATLGMDPYHRHGADELKWMMPMPSDSIESLSLSLSLCVLQYRGVSLEDEGAGVVGQVHLREGAGPPVSVR